MEAGPTVVLGRKGMGNLGVEWCSGPFWVIDTAYYTSFGGAILPLYFYYFTNFMGLNHLKDGTSNPSLSRDVFGRQFITLPPVRIQRQVVAILSALDEKMDLNRRMNETLETMTRAIFKDWFVDFGPTRAKAEGREPYLSPDVWSRFPDRLDYGGKPDGWTISSLGDLAEIERGLSYKGSGLASSGFPMHNLNSILEGGGYKFGGIKYYVGNFSSRHVVNPGDLIVANTEQGHHRLLIGYAAIVPRNFGASGLFSQHLYRVRPTRNSPISAAFMYELLNSDSVHDGVSASANGSTVNMLPLDSLSRLTFPLPGENVVQSFNRITEPMRDRVEGNVAENEDIVATRDLLLPKLMSGEVRIKDAEKTAEAVL